MGLFTGDVTYEEFSEGYIDVLLNGREIGTLYPGDGGRYVFEYDTNNITRHFLDLEAFKEWIEENAGDVEDGRAV